MVKSILIFLVLMWESFTDLISGPVIRRNVLTENVAVSGIDVTLGIDAAGGSSFNEFAGQRNTVLTRSIDKADSTNKDSDNWEESVPIIRHWSITVTGVLVDETDVAYVDLESAYHAAAAAVAQVECEVTMPSGTTYTGTANLDDLTVEGPHDGIMTVSVELSGSGVLTKA